MQGDFDLHARMLERIGAPWRLIRHAEDLEAVEGLILPGGESTAMLRLFAKERLDDAIREFAAAGKPVFGTCAGAILMAREVLGPEQDSLGLLDITIERNAYGRQIDSAMRAVECPELSDHPVVMAFIRAPIIRQIGRGVRILGSAGGFPVLVEQQNLLAATFHPELDDDETIHRYFNCKMKSALKS